MIFIFFFVSGNPYLNTETKSLQKMGVCGAHFNLERDLNPNGIGQNRRLREDAKPKHYSCDGLFLRVMEQMVQSRLQMDGIKVAEHIQKQAFINSLDCMRDQEIEKVKRAKDEEIQKIREEKDREIQQLNERIKSLETSQSKLNNTVKREKSKREKLEVNLTIKSNQCGRLLKDRRQWNKKMQRVQKARVKLKEKLADIKIHGMSSAEFFKKHHITSEMSEALITLQTRVNNRPFTTSEKNFSQQFYYYSASAYRAFVRGGVRLPSEESVRRWVGRTKMGPGIIRDNMEKLKEKLSKLRDEEKVGGLKFDEIVIKSGAEYNKYLDFVEGLVDLGEGKRSKELAKHALVFFYDGVNADKPYREFLAYYCVPKGGARAETLKKIIDELLAELLSIGADVRFIACDQGPNNTSLYTKYFGFSAQKALDGEPQYYEFLNRKIILTYDFPHLVKRVVYALRRHYVIYDDQGQVLVNFKDLINVFAYDRLNCSSTALPKITPTHMTPNTFDSMNVKRAFQICSKSFSAALKVAATDAQFELKFPNSRKSLRKSSKFLDTMDTAIDILNSSKGSPKEWKVPLSDKNKKSRDFLRNFIQQCRTWHIRSTNAKGKETFTKQPCFIGLTATAAGLLKLAEDLHKDFPGFELATRLCCQDSVENYFSIIRQRGGHNPNPTARTFRLACRHIKSTKNITASQKGNVQLENPTVAPETNNDISKLTNIVDTIDVVHSYTKREPDFVPKVGEEEFSKDQLPNVTLKDDENFGLPMPDTYDVVHEEYINVVQARDGVETTKYSTEYEVCGNCQLKETPGEVDANVNCQCPTISLNDFDLSEAATLDCDDFNTTVNIQPSSDIENCLNPETYLKVVCANKFERCSINYFAGYALRNIRKKKKHYERHKKFVESLTKSPSDMSDGDDDLIKHRQYRDKDDETPTDKLLKPTRDFSVCVATMLNFFEENWESVWHEEKLLHKLVLKAENDEQLKRVWLTDDDNYESRVLLMRLIFLVKIYNRCKLNNQLAKEGALEIRRQNVAKRIARDDAKAKQLRLEQEQLNPENCISEESEASEEKENLEKPQEEERLEPIKARRRFKQLENEILLDSVAVESSSTSSVSYREKNDSYARKMRNITD